MCSLLGLTSARYGRIRHCFDDFEELTNETLDAAGLDPGELETYNDFFEEFNFSYDYQLLGESGLIYVSGFVAFRMEHRVTCTVCIRMFKSDEEIDDQYFQDINRGGLRVPSNLTIELGHLASSVMQGLISEKYESSFIKSKSHKKLLLHLLEEGLVFLLRKTDEKCESCNETHISRFIEAFGIFSNILLNNYRKCKSDAIHRQTASSSGKSSEKGKGEKVNSRKPSTLKK